MQEEIDKGLKIYKASAGSGKTYTLVREYLDLLLQEGNIDGYKSILVATFTNKATTELRERIVKELKKRIDASDDHKSRLAREVLEAILLDYDSLRVQTIDSFFQEVVRSFVFELNNDGAGADVELDRNGTIEMSVDQLLINLPEEHFHLIEEALESDLEAGKNPDIRNEVVALAKKLLYNPELKGKDLSKFTFQRIKAAQAELKDKLGEAYSAIEDIYTPLRDWLVAHEELLEASTYKFLLSVYNKGVDGLLADQYKVPGKYIYHSKVDVQAPTFVIGKSRKDALALELLGEQETLRPLLIELDEVIRSQAPTIWLSEELLKHLQLLPLFSSLQQAMKDYQREHKIILIDEINLLLDKIIDGASTPFIYEKVGGRIRHYMIDEFQDTSATQWENFKVLLEEAISQPTSAGGAQKSFIVGDVKQSIYRWRGTDSSLLNSKVEDDPVFSGQIDAQPLESNWRSDYGIVEFNNHFFHDIYSFQEHTNGTEGDDEVHKKVYATENEVKQTPRYSLGKGHGYVRLEYLPKEKKQRGEEYDEETSELQDPLIKERIRDLVVSLQRNDGYKAGDIAFIVRENKEGFRLAEILSELAREADEGEKHYFSFLSDEALLITNSSVVKLITALFRLLASPDDEQSKMLFEVASIAAGAYSSMDKLWEVARSGRSMMETAHDLLQAIHIPDGEELYVNAFLDLLLEFTQSSIATYTRFVDWWERVGVNKQVAMGTSSSDKMQIITIHKAKGLEFPIVIMPSVDWALVKNIPNSVDFLIKEELPQGFLKEPLDFYLIDGYPSSVKLVSPLKHKYNQILENNYLDNLNLLYVAFTRPKNRLYLFTSSTPGDKKSVSNIVYDRIAKIPMHQSDNVWEYGEPLPKVSGDEAAEETIRVALLPDYQHPHTGIPQLKVEGFDNEHTLYGKQMHDAMARALTPPDFHAAIKRISLPEEEEILHHFTTTLESPLVHSWFAPSPTRQVLVEQTIASGALSYRPDRVILEGGEATVIDFKFGAPERRHHKQVQRYMELMQKMGYRTHGYLWYWSQPEEIVQVKDIKQ